MPCGGRHKRERRVVMQFQSGENLEWVKYLPFLLVAGVLAPALLPVIIIGLVAFYFAMAVKKNQKDGAAARKRGAQAPSRPRFEGRPLKPAAPASAQPHSHTDKSEYDPITGGYYFFDVQPCTCPRCGFVTDTSHRFCSKCDTDLSKPHDQKKRAMKKKP